MDENNTITPIKSIGNGITPNSQPNIFYVNNGWNAEETDTSEQFFTEENAGIKKRGIKVKDRNSKEQFHTEGNTSTKEGGNKIKDRNSKEQFHTEGNTGTEEGGSKSKERNSNEQCYTQGNTNTDKRGNQYRDTTQIKNLVSISKWRKVLVLIAAIYLQFSSGGFLYALGNIYTDVIQTLDVDRTEASLILSLTRGITIGTGVVSGALLKRYGNAPCILVGSLLSSFGLLISSFLTNVIAISLCMGIIAGCGLSVLLLASYTSTATLFVDNPVLGLTLVSLGFGTGQIIFPIGTEYLIQFGNWNGALLIFSGLMLNNLVGCIIIYYSMEKGRTKPSDVGKSTRIFDKTLLKNYFFVIFLPCYFLLGMTVNVESLFLVDHMVLIGYPRETGAYLLTVSGISGLICRITEGFIFAKFRAKAINHETLSFIALGCVHLLFAFIKDIWTLFVLAVLYGIAVSVFGALVAPMTVDHIGIEHFAVATGSFNTVFGIASAVGAIFGGYINDIAGSYDIVFLAASGALFLVSIIFIMMICVPKIQRRGYTALE